MGEVAAGAQLEPLNPVGIVQVGVVERAKLNLYAIRSTCKVMARARAGPGRDRGGVTECGKELLTDAPFLGREESLGPR